MEHVFDEISGCNIAKIKSIGYDANLALISHSKNDSNTTGKIPVLFFHGATVPTLMTSAFKIEGMSWFDALSEDNRPVYGLDLLGYGESDAYPLANEVGEKNPEEYGMASTLIDEIDHVVDVLLERYSVNSIHIIAISRGANPMKVKSLILHGPITRQKNLGTAVIKKYFGTPRLPKVSHFSVSAFERFNLLKDDRPEDTKSPLEDDFIESWPHHYSQRVHGDQSKIHDPIKAPMGFAVDISNAWNDIYFDETQLTMPVMILRGEWDNILTPRDSCQNLFDKIPSRSKIYIQLSEATHSMMFEKCRWELYSHTKSFLSKNDIN